METVACHFALRSGDRARLESCVTAMGGHARWVQEPRLRDAANHGCAPVPGLLLFGGRAEAHAATAIRGPEQRIVHEQRNAARRDRALGPAPHDEGFSGGTTEWRSHRSPHIGFSSIAREVAATCRFLMSAQRSHWTFAAGGGLRVGWSTVVARFCFVWRPWAERAPLALGGRMVGAGVGR